MEHILYAFHQSMFHSGSNLFFGACKLLISLTFSARLMRAFLEQCNGLFEERAAAVRCCGALIAGSLESTVVRALVQDHIVPTPWAYHSQGTKGRQTALKGLHPTLVSAYCSSLGDGQAMKTMTQLRHLKFPAAMLLFTIAASGCTFVSNQLGGMKAAELLSRAKVPAVCNDGKSAFDKAPCDRAFCLGPLAMEVAVAEEQVACCPDESDGRCPSAKFIQPPSPIVQVPSHDNVRSVLGGKGQGLNCSIPSFVEPLFFDPSQFNTENGTPAAPLSLQFAQACYAHDMCYRHGAATYGYEKADCDDLLFDQTYRLCTSIYRSRTNVAQSSKQEKDSIQTCKAQAGSVYLGVAEFGGRSFQPLGQSTFFEFDPMARATRAPFRVSRLIPRGEAGSRESWELLHYRFGPDNVSMRTQNGQWKTLGGIGNRRLRQMPAPRSSGRTERSDGEIESTYVIAQRDVLRNTGTRIMVLPQGGTTVTELQRPASKPDDEAFDCNSAVHLPVSSSAGVTMYTFGIATLDNSRERCPPLITQGSSSIKISPIRLDALASANYYRLQQLEPMLGRFGMAGEPQLLMLARGTVYPRGSGTDRAAQAASSRGDGYKQKATAFTVSLDGKARGAEAVDIPEAELPVAPFLRESAARDGLLSLHAAASNGVEATLWQRTDAGEEGGWNVTRSRIPDLTTSWLEMPAQVLAGQHGDRVILTRIDLNSNQAVHSTSPRIVNLQFQALSLDKGGSWRRVACSKKSVAIGPLPDSESKVFRIQPEAAWRNAQAIPFWKSAETISVFFVPHPGEEQQQLLDGQLGDGLEPVECDFT